MQGVFTVLAVTGPSISPRLDRYQSHERFVTGNSVWKMLRLDAAVNAVRQRTGYKGRVRMQMSAQQRGRESMAEENSCT